MIPFSSIPPHLQCRIIEMGDFKTFTRLLRVSKEMQAICVNSNASFLIYANHVYYSERHLSIWPKFHSDKIPWKRFATYHMRIKIGTFFVSGFLNDTQTEHIMKKFRRHSAKAEKISFQSSTPLSDDVIRNILQTLEPESLEFLHHVPRSYFQLSDLQKVKALNFASDVEIEERCFLQFSATEFLFGSSRTLVDPSLINKLIKQWFNGERERPYIRVAAEYNDEQIGRITEDLPFNVVWTPEHHRNSIISCLGDIGDIHLRLFSIFRPSNASEVCHLIFSRGNMKFICPNVPERFHLIVSLPRDLNKQYRMLNDNSI